jgi:hypothetical protein
MAFTFPPEKLTTDDRRPTTDDRRPTTVIVVGLDFIVCTPSFRAVLRAWGAGVEVGLPTPHPLPPLSLDFAYVLSSK